ncbi:hypothetical protein EVAR_6651_1 [Eumeta japonica]|uniref:Uncharacterized protein n=1 Tax=Eumeta variegata TaxID=151549 RepID=A0A4C1TLR8_EUMVA|nr:hypothetical protein EVAR_6651_1 [Eumeta japonica]
MEQVRLSLIAVVGFHFPRAIRAHLPSDSHYLPLRQVSPPAGAVAARLRIKQTLMYAYSYLNIVAERGEAMVTRGSTSQTMGACGRRPAGAGAAARGRVIY